MTFTLSDDEELIAKTVAELASQHGSEAAAELDRHDGFPTEFLASAAVLGLMGVTLGADEGGAGVTPTSYALTIMEIAKVDPAAAAIVAAHNGLGLRIAHDHALIPAAVAGELVATLATEEAHGSDKSKLSTVAVTTDDGFALTGMKVWGLGVLGAAHFLVLAEADAGPTWFHVAAGTPGLTIGSSESLLGLRAAGLRTVYLNDVRVGPEAIVGRTGDGLARWKAAQPWLQVGVAAALVGAVAGAQSVGIDFAEHRVQFGNPVGAYQAVSDTVTEIDLQLAAARALCLEAAGHLESDDAAPWAARAKAFAANMAILMTRKVIRVQGGTGFMREGGSERYARDVRALQFMGEPVAIQRDTLKRHIMDLDFGPTP
jgi:alkylation response protein AidB-like acyl-CoA dehydrogenase